MLPLDSETIYISHHKRDVLYIITLVITFWICCECRDIFLFLLLSHSYIKFYAFPFEHGKIYEGCSINSWTTFINQKRVSAYLYNLYEYQRDTFSYRKI